MIVLIEIQIDQASYQAPMAGVIFDSGLVISTKALMKFCLIGAKASTFEFNSLVILRASSGLFLIKSQVLLVPSSFNVFRASSLFFLVEAKAPPYINMTSGSAIVVIYLKSKGEKVWVTWMLFVILVSILFAVFHQFFSVFGKSVVFVSKRIDL